MSQEYLIKYHMRQAGYGWTYSFIWVGDSARLAVDHAEGFIDSLLAVHFGWTVLERISASSYIGLDRDSFSKPYERTRLNTQGANPANPDVVKVAAVVQLWAEGNQTRRLWLRGVADVDVALTDATKSNIPATLKEPLDKLIADLSVMDFRIASLVPPADTGVGAWRKVGTITPDVDGAGDAASKVTTIGAHGYGVDSILQFKRPRNDIVTLGLRGQHRPIQPADTTFLLPVTYRGRGETLILPNLFVRAVTYQFPEITGGQFVRFSTRDTGPSRLSRGREPGLSFR